MSGGYASRHGRLERLALQLSECCFCLADAVNLAFFWSLSVSGRALSVTSCRFDPLPQVPCGTSSPVRDFAPHQHCPVSISFRTKPATSRKNGAQAALRVQFRTCRRANFPADRHGCTNVQSSAEAAESSKMSPSSSGTSVFGSPFMAAVSQLEPIARAF